MRSPWEPQTNIFYFVCIVLVVIYLFHASWGLNHLDFSGNNKIQPDVAHLEAHFANLRGFSAIFKTHKGHLGTPDQYFSVCIWSPSWYLPIPSHLRLWPLKFLVIITRFNLLLAILRLIWGLFGLLKTHEGPLGTLNQCFLLWMSSSSYYLPIPCLLFHFMLYNSQKIKIATGQKSHLHTEMKSQLPVLVASGRLDPIIFLTKNSDSLPQN
jgi:hypothetical protein